MTDPILAPPITTPTSPAAPDLQQQIAALQQQLAALAPAAARGEAALAAERAQLDAKIARLSQADREAVARLSEADRAVMTDRLLASPGSFRAPPVIGGGPPPPAGPSVDVGAEIAKGTPVYMLKEKHPEAFARFLDAQRPPPPRTTMWSNAMALAREKSIAASSRGHRR